MTRASPRKRRNACCWLFFLGNQRWSSVSLIFHLPWRPNVEFDFTTLCRVATICQGAIKIDLSPYAKPVMSRLTLNARMYSKFLVTVSRQSTHLTVKSRISFPISAKGEVLYSFRKRKKKKLFDFVEKKKRDGEEESLWTYYKGNESMMRLFLWFFFFHFYILMLIYYI